MGNNVLCSENKIGCTEKCTRISLGPERNEPSSVAGHSPDPAGAIFDDTLDELNDVDRQLILFSSTSNLIAVRWLLALGANRFACDSNGTTCLHAACRSGSLAIVESFVRLEESDTQRTALASADVAGWTPLHIAAFMGRHEVVLRLVQAGCPADKKTLTGQAASDLCSDARVRELLLITGSSRFASSASSRFAAVPLSAADRSDAPNGGAMDRAAFGGTVDSTSREVRFEPFFVPRTPVIREKDRSVGFYRQLLALARAIFNRQPGRGLSFLVASGCVRDYPIDLVGFMRNSMVDQSQIGTFLGEDFSLSKILRMEFINAVGLVNSGVTSCLSKAFSHFRAPPDLQKADRILSSVAEVWWRQHNKVSTVSSDSKAEERGSTKSSSGEGDAAPSDELPDGQEAAACRKELQGVELRKLLGSVWVLHQLLFSALMLHWNMHAPLPRSQRLSLEAWLDLHHGLRGPKGDLAEDVLEPIYRGIKASDKVQLWLGNPHSEAAEVLPPQPPDQAAVGAAQPTVAGATAEETSAVVASARVEGWVRVISSGLPAMLGGSGRPGLEGSSAMASGAWSDSSDCLKVAGMLSEATASSRRRPPDPGRQGSRTPTHAGARASAVVALPSCAWPNMSSQPLPPSGWQTRRSPDEELPRDPNVAPDAIWLSLCHSLLFLSAYPGGSSPFAFVHLQSAQFAGIDPHKSVVSISGAAEPEGAGAPLERPAADAPPKAGASPRADAAAGAAAKAQPLQMVFLLPDGRWQAFDVPQLVIEVCDRAQLEGWVLQLTEVCSTAAMESSKA